MQSPKPEWSVYLSILIASLPTDAATMHAAQQHVYEYINALETIALSSHDQGYRCLHWERAADKLRDALEQLAGPPDLPDVPPFPPEESHDS